MVPAGTSFGQLLRRLRIKAGLTQKELADRLGLTRGMISWWETAMLQPTAARARLVARVLNERLPEDERIDEQSFVKVLSEVRRFYEEEAKSVDSRRSKRLPFTTIHRDATVQVFAHVSQETIVALEGLISETYYARSHVVRQLLLEALKSKRIVNKIKNS